MKKLIYIIIFAFLFLISSVFSIGLAAAKDTKTIEIQFFYSTTCPHCAKEEIFLDNLKQKYPQIQVNSYEFSDKETQATLEQFYNQYNVNPSQKGLVPITFIKEKYFIGFNEDLTGKEIENYLTNSQEVASDETKNITDDVTDVTPQDKIKVSLIGEINADKYSLPFLAVILGFFDGFNVCSLGALLLILGIVLTFRSRAKILLFGLTFILTTAITYGFLIFVWHKIFLALAPCIAKMEFVIGILALGGAGYFLWQFIKTKKQGPTCQSQGALSEISQKLSNVFQKTSNVIILAGAILLFAVVITMIEFPCSAVLPVLFASMISEANLSAATSYFYIAIFLFFYMLDEIIVFLIAFFSLKIWVSSPKVTIWVNLAASIILLILGIYYLLI